MKSANYFLKHNIVSTLFLLLTYHSAGALPVEITQQNAAVVYEVKADIPTPAERIAEVISTDYRNLRDEFSKHEFLEKLKPTIEKRIQEAKETESFYVIVSDYLGEYDFSRKAFPTGTGPQTFIPLNKYAVRFSNYDAIGFVSVPLEEAKKAATALKGSRHSTITYTGVIEKCTEEKLNYHIYKVIYLKVKNISIRLDKSGTQFTQKID
ncbi:MAG: DUF4852 domain-containing protein [Chthoniobacterales bacterium]